MSKLHEDAAKKVTHKLTYYDKDLTKLINDCIAASSSDSEPYYMAVCPRTDHPDGATWQSTKSSDSRQPLLDAIEHNSETGHAAGVIGPIG